MTIDRWIVDAATREADKPALITDNEIITFGALASRIDERARGLTAASVGRGDRVAWYGLNHPEVFVLFFSCARLCATFVPLNWRLANAEIAEIVAGCDPKLVFHDEEFREEARALRGVSVVSRDAPLPLETSCRQGSSSEDDPVLLVFTSGSTGRPKGVVLTQRAIACNAAMSAEAHELGPDSRVLNVLPLFHVGGLNILPTPAFSIGATVYLHERFDPDAACHAQRNVTHVITVPTVLQAMIDCSNWQDVDLSSLVSISIGSTDVPLPLIEFVQARGVPVMQIYGATETGPLAIYQSADEAMETAGSIGCAGSRCSVRLVKDGADVADGETGEIWVKGDNTLKEYWRSPELTEEVLCDGWFRTGDVARRDADGIYWFVDRIKHVIISGGENIYPAEIERLLREVDGMVEVCVVGRPDPKWGETPVAVVVAGRDMTADEVLGPLQGRLARYKQPKFVPFVEALPRNSMGKVVAADVRAMVEHRSQELVTAD